ncbi:hypothetical protein UFOVP366_5 [uncultured Caudovirales phage]|uniref:Uncharacterized protein n=1 Tax=uncultured Caudovirales phage TaxID=2100421 RepID=A0A6J7X5B7_9CAUD|nr:hypothetical protein UFOVP366_5 [uncultured Caudovirales phage]
MSREQYFAKVNEQIDALNRATDLVWDWEHTGGGCDALVCAFPNPSDFGEESPRLAYVMLTCDASVVQVDRDRYAMLGYYADYYESDEADKEAYLNDESHPPLTLVELVDFVAETLQGWGVK